MAKKIRFPLAMADGVQVRTLDELKEHFDLEAVLEYYKSGKLLTWLQDRYLETEAEAIQALDEQAADLPADLCKIFDIEYHGEPIDVAEIARRQERLKQLRAYTDEKDFIDHIDQVAFDQEELADLLDDGQKQIYLCGEKFSIPLSQHGVHYIGINSPKVSLSGSIPTGLSPNTIDISIIGCRGDISDISIHETTPPFTGINSPIIRISGKDPNGSTLDNLNIFFEGCRPDASSQVANQDKQLLDKIADFKGRLQERLSDLKSDRDTTCIPHIWVKVERFCDPDICSYETAYPEKRCKQIAEDLLFSIYSEYTDALNDYSEKRGEKSLYNNWVEIFDKVLNSSLDEFSELRLEIEPEIKSTIDTKMYESDSPIEWLDQIEKLLDGAEIYEALEKDYDRWKDSATIFEFNRYTSSINYESFDAPESLTLAYMLSSCRYSYNIYEAVKEIDNDANEALESFVEYFSDDFFNDIEDLFDDLQDLLTQLYKFIEKN